MQGEGLPGPHSHCSARESLRQGIAVCVLLLPGTWWLGMYVNTYLARSRFNYHAHIQVISSSHSLLREICMLVLTGRCRPCRAIYRRLYPMRFIEICGMQTVPTCFQNATPVTTISSRRRGRFVCCLWHVACAAEPPSIMLRDGFSGQVSFRYLQPANGY